ncbi:hypothetical protein ABAC460_20610 [Asticcacaulis sp. AC460]|uniref:calcium-binding protein n=1 Tax=Asticcacaulis sp. AC460 TaxID=1282360 RepID=UPI0003C412BD|nr:calcium-binding protein [Asticcacaulis sp. AC460]ESQ87176.1 hypothetical protein ABAC460_20610 [Asticcacaulis sp. AC460]
MRKPTDALFLAVPLAALNSSAGDDTYYVNSPDDVVTENPDEGIDTVVSTITYALGDNVENLTLAGNNHINATGNALNNILTGNVGNNILSGGLGDDTYYIQNAGDMVEEAHFEGTDTIYSTVSYSLFGRAVENFIMQGNGNLTADGNSLNNILTGNGGANWLDGMAGADTLTGGLGDDTYVVNASSDVVIEAANAGYDLTETSVNWTLGANVEWLRLAGTANIDGTGNSGANVLQGNAGDNRLDGGAGADNLYGGVGDDTYIVDNAGDKVFETAGQGKDTVYSSVTFRLQGTSVENLTLTGTDDITAYGNNSSNLMTGNSGNNTFFASVGADTVIGGLGNDTYYVLGATHTVVEKAGEGDADTIYASVDYNLYGQHVEILILDGYNAYTAIGNSLANTLIGNNRNNTLSGLAGHDSLDGGDGWDTLMGGTGNDTLMGGAGYDRLDGGDGVDMLTGGDGNDTYIIDDLSDLNDVIVELADGGFDTIEAIVDWTLGANMEGVYVIGSADLKVTGNSLDNILGGNIGNNVLDGKGGSDSMGGGRGNDTYIVNTYSDKVIEAAGEGTDLVLSSDTFSLYQTQVENLTLTGTGNTNGTGNGLANILIGNSGANTLNGMGSKDTITGGGGADVFLFLAASGKDIITDFSAGDNDSINVNAYTGGTANAGLVTQAGADVLITLDANNVITVQAALKADVLAHIVW